tara:strand:- start:19 stop:351 length:333 start_codon:yes stop_codon:yes gene_type:complete
MKLLLENWRRYIKEATEYDEQLGRILDSDTPEQAIELAASIGIPAKDLPWNYKRIENYIISRIGWMPNQNYAIYLEERAKILEEVGISEEEYYQMYTLGPVWSIPEKKPT